MSAPIVIGGALAAAYLLDRAPADPGKPASWTGEFTKWLRMEYPEATSYADAAERALRGEGRLHPLPARPSMRDMYKVADFWLVGLGTKSWDEALGDIGGNQLGAFAVETPGAWEAYRAFRAYATSSLSWTGTFTAPQAQVDKFRAELRKLGRALDGDKHTEYVDKGLFGNTVAVLGEDLGTVLSGAGTLVGELLGGIVGGFLQESAIPLIIVGGAAVAAYVYLR